MNQWTWNRSMDRRRFCRYGTRLLTAAALTSGGSAFAAFSLAKDVFHPDPDEFRKILKIAGRYGADVSEIFMEQKQRRIITMVNGRVSDGRREHSEGGAVRIVKDGHTASAWTDGLEPAALRDIARKVRHSLPKSSRRVKVPELKGKPEHFRGAILAMDPIEKVPDSRCMDVLRTIHDHAGKTSNLVTDIRLDYRDEARWILICNSSGLYRIDYQPLISLAVTVTSHRKGITRTARRALAHRTGFELFRSSEPRVIASSAVAESIDMLVARPMTARRTSVIIESGAAGPLFAPILAKHLRGDAAADGSSPWKDLSGSLVSVPGLTLVDNGRYPRMAGTAHIDDEGTITGSHDLIRNGKLAGFLTDSIRAKHLHLPDTGNLRRASYREPPHIQPTNTHISPGDAVPDDILAETARGIYINRLGEGTPEPGTDRWIYPVLAGVAIRDGKAVHPVNGIALRCGATSFLGRIDRIAGNFDSRPVPGSIAAGIPRSFGNPTLRIRNMDILPAASGNE